MTLILCTPIYTELQNSMDSRMWIVYAWVSGCVSVCACVVCVSVCVFTAGVGLCLCVRGCTCVFLWVLPVCIWVCTCRSVCMGIYLWVRLWDHVRVLHVSVYLYICLLGVCLAL